MSGDSKAHQWPAVIAQLTTEAYARRKEASWVDGEDPMVQPVVLDESRECTSVGSVLRQNLLTNLSSLPFACKRGPYVCLEARQTESYTERESNPHRVESAWQRRMIPFHHRCDELVADDGAERAADGAERISTTQQLREAVAWVLRCAPKQESTDVLISWRSPFDIWLFVVAAFRTRGCP